MAPRIRTSEATPGTVDASVDGNDWHQREDGGVSVDTERQAVIHPEFRVDPENPWDAPVYEELSTGRGQLTVSVALMPEEDWAAITRGR